MHILRIRMRNMGIRVVGKMTDEEWQNLYENFDTTQILDAVKVTDEPRQHLSNRVVGILYPCAQ